MLTPARTAFFTLSLVPMTLAGCGNQPKAAQDESPTPIASIAPSGEPASDTVTTEDPGPTAEELAAADSPPVEPKATETEAARRPAPKQDSPSLAELGRPEWWFSDVKRDDRSIRICAEAGGPTVREARRAAIDAARQRLALEVEIDPTRENVSLATVLPLPAASTGPGGARYIGYVMMEVPTP